MGQKRHNPKYVFFLVLTVLVSVSLWLHFFFLDAIISSVCLSGTVRLASCIHVVVQVPHDRRSRPAPCHG